MTDHKSSSQLLQPKALVIGLLVIIIVALSGVFLWQSFEYDRQVSQNYLPKLAKQKAISIKISELQGELSELSIGNGPVSLSSAHQQIIENLRNLKSEGRYSREFFPLLENDEIDNLANRLVSNETRNSALTDETLGLINLINHSMIDLLAVMRDRQANLYNQVLADKVSDRVTASRAIAHTNVSHDIQDYQEANRHLNKVSATLEEMSFLSKSDDIDLLEQSAEKFNQWQGVYQDQLAAENDELAKQLTLLDDLLFNDDRLIAKWRGQVRLAQDYLIAIDEQNAKLGLLFERNQRAISPPIPALANFLKSYQLNLANQDIYIGLAIVITMLLFAVFLLLNAILRRTTKLEQETEQLVGVSIGKNEATLQELSTQSQHQIQSMLNDVIQPEHDESAYQALKQQLELFHHMLSTYGNGLYIQDDAVKGSNISLNESSFNWLITMTSVDLSYRSTFSWRRLVSAKQTREIVESVRRLKQNKELATQLNLAFDNGKYACLNLIATERGISVFIFDETERSIEVNELNQTIEQLQIDEQKQWQGEQQVFSHIHRKLASACLSQQSLARIDRASLRHAQQLNQLLQWSEGGQLWARNHVDKTNPEFTEVKLAQALSGMICEAQYQRNHLFEDRQQSLIFEHLDNENMALESATVLLDMANYHYVLSYLLDIQFVRQHGDLTLKTKIVDQNAAQLMVKYHFTYEQEQPLENLPAAMLLISHQVESQPKASTFDQGYFARALLDYLHVDKIELIQQSHGWQFSFELPHSTQQNIEKIKAEYEAPSLSTRIVLIVKEEANRNYLDSLLKPYSTEVIAVSSLEHAHGFFDVNRLEKKKIGLVITADESGHHDTHQLLSLIEQLPERLMPKLFVLDDVSTLPLSQYDTHGYNLNLKLGANLLDVLSQFMQSEAYYNRVFDHQDLQSLNCQKSNISVLVAMDRFSEQHYIGALLNWLGFKVCVATSIEQANSQWQSGLHRILVTDYPLTDLNSIKLKKQLRRTAISLSKTEFKGSDALSVFNMQADASVKEWLETLSPWLAIKPQKVAKTIAYEAPTTSVIESPKLNEASLLSFDVSQYAQNVGGPELAAIMADEYFEQLETLVEQLKYSLAVKSMVGAKEQAVKLEQVSKIIASKELLAWSEQLSHCIEQQAMSDASHLLPEIARDIQDLKRFAEAI